MNYEVILLSGKMGAGKSDTAKLLVIKLFEQGWRAIRMKFAAPLYMWHDSIKKYCQENGIPLPEEKDRDLLLALGLWGREQDPQIWSKILKARIENSEKHAASTKRVYIVDDLRFKNEFEMFKDCFTVRLQCPKEIRIVRAESWKDIDDKPSECELDDETRFDRFIDTDYNSLGDVVKMILARFNMHTR